MVSGWGLVPDDQRNEMKRRGGVLVCIGGGLLLVLIGFAGGMAPLGWIGVLALVAGVGAVYKDAKKRGAAKRKAAEESEIRAHQLRQARGQSVRAPAVWSAATYPVAL
jgi:hypothetical protein